MYRHVMLTLLFCVSSYVVQSEGIRLRDIYTVKDHVDKLKPTVFDEAKMPKNVNVQRAKELSTVFSTSLLPGNR
jgi:hypothetical protein